MSILLYGCTTWTLTKRLEMKLDGNYTRFIRSEAGTQLSAFSQISAHASGAWRHSYPLVSIPIWDFYFDISEWHILSAHAWTPALMLPPTNPCAKRKVLSLTKPKGKIYKMKSLGNYITLLFIFYINSDLLPLEGCDTRSIFEQFSISHLL